MATSSEGDDDVLADLNRVTRLEGFSARADLIGRYEDRTVPALAHRGLAIATGITA